MEILHYLYTHNAGKVQIELIELISFFFKRKKSNFFHNQLELIKLVTCIVIEILKIIPNKDTLISKYTSMRQPLCAESFFRLEKKNRTNTKHDYIKMIQKCHRQTIFYIVIVCVRSSLYINENMSIFSLCGFFFALTSNITFSFFCTQNRILSQTRTHTKMRTQQPTNNNNLTTGYNSINLR